MPTGHWEEPAFFTFHTLINSTPGVQMVSSGTVASATKDARNSLPFPLALALALLLDWQRLLQLELSAEENRPHRGAEGLPVPVGLLLLLLFPPK